MRVMKILLCGLLMAMPVFAEEAEDRQTATSLHYVSHELDTRQDKLSTGANAALTYTNSAGNVVQRDVKSDLNNGSTTDTSLPQVNAVNAGLDSKQDDISTIDDHTAVTYTNSVGTIGQKGIYQDTGTYAEQSDNLIDAKTFNAALKNGLDSEFVCGGTKPGTDTCWLWQIHNESINLFDKNNPAMSYAGYIQNKSVGEDSWLISYDGGDKVLFVKCKPNTTYTVQRKTDISTVYNRIRVCAFTSANVPVANNHCTMLVNDMNTTQTSATFTTLSDTTWCGINVRNSGPVGADWQTYLDNFQVELGSTATPYVPHNGNDGVYIPQNQQ